MKKVLLTMLCIVFVLCSFGGCGESSNDSQSSMQSSTDKTLSPAERPVPEGYSKYTNEKISFNYPATWKKTIKEKKDILTFDHRNAYVFSEEESFNYYNSVDDEAFVEAFRGYISESIGISVTKDTVVEKETSRENKTLSDGTKYIEYTCITNCKYPSSLSLSDQTYVDKILVIDGKNTCEVIYFDDFPISKDWNDIWSEFEHSLTYIGK